MEQHALPGLAEAVVEERLAEDAARELDALARLIGEESAGRFSPEEFIGATLLHFLFRGQDTERKRPVLFTVTRESDKDAAIQFEIFRQLLAIVRDRRIGLEYAALRVTVAEDVWQCCISTFHSDCQPLGSFVATRGVAVAPSELVAVERVVELLSSLVSQVNGLHRAGFTHGDISPTNILVDEHWDPHVIDFDLVSDGGAPMSARREGGTARFAHPEKAGRVAAALNGRAGLPTQAERIRWDMYSLGQTLRAVLREYAPEELFRRFPAFHQRYLALVSCRMLDGCNGVHEVALGIPHEHFAAIAYGSLEEVKVDLAKLSGTYSVVNDVPELDQAVPSRLQASSQFEIVLTGRLKQTLGLHELQALAGVRQLGLINFVFPSANHTRFEHALGTYAATCQYVRWLLRDEENPFFRQLVTARHVRVLLVAALLHDIGHFPLAHDFEDAEFHIFDHENRTARMFDDDQSALVATVCSPEPDGWDVSPEEVQRLLRGDRNSGDIVYEMLRTILSGPIDADKVDYLVRDSERLAVRYGEGIDIARLGATLTTIVDFRRTRPPGSAAGVSIGVNEKGVGAAETVAFARYAMFKNVYWHHSYRAVKAMIQWVVWEYLHHHWVTAGGDRRSFAAAVEADFAFLVGNPATDPQLSLFLRNESVPKLREVASLMPLPERMILEWCARDAPSAEAMVTSIIRRRLFSRVLVMSVGRDLDKDLWIHHLDDFFDRREDSAGKGWKRRYMLARRYQKFVLESVLEADSAGSYLVGGAALREEFVAAAAQEQVVLVDFPDPGRARQTSLRYLVEEERRHRRVTVDHGFDVEESGIFGAIGKEFAASIGKVRVFVDPKFAPLIVNALPRSELQRGFDRLLQEARESNPEREFEFVARPHPRSP